MHWTGYLPGWPVDPEKIAAFGSSYRVYAIQM